MVKAKVSGVKPKAVDVRQSQVVPVRAAIMGTRPLPKTVKVAKRKK